jgi:hypothetical protein
MGEDVDQLKREAELARVAFRQSATELKHEIASAGSELKEKASLGYVRQQARSLVRERVETLWERAQRTARENPLQAVAAGAAISYPLFGILRRLPAPLFVIGAGFWLARNNGRNSTVEGIKSETARVSDAFKKQVQETAVRAEEAGEAAIRTANKVRENIARTVGDKLSAAVEVASEAGSKISAGAAAGIASVGDTLSAHRPESPAQQDAGTNQVSSGRDGFRSNPRNAISALLESNPLLVTGAGLALGAFVAACLPTIKAERQLVKKAADGIKDAAAGAAAETISKMKEVGANVAQSTRDAAVREGLDPEGIGHAVDEVSSAVKNVAERSLDAAFGTRDDEPATRSGGVQ